VTGSGKHVVAIRPAQRSAAEIAETIDEVVTAVGRRPRPQERWLVKLNLTFPRYLPGVVNSSEFVEGLCQWARDLGVELLLAEGDGGNGSYSAADTFAGNGVDVIAARYGARCLSLSDKPWHWRTTQVAGVAVRLPYSPVFERREFDRFVTAPLFKNHVFTIVTLGMKNLWGCIPDAYRMYYHHVLDHGIVALHNELRPDFSLFDGVIGLRGRGPMDGKPVEMNVLMAASDVGAGELAALHIMQTPLERVRHLQLAQRVGVVPAKEDLTWNGDPRPHLRSDFIVDRSWLNRVSILLAKKPKLQRLVYHSPVSAALYAVVNRVRGKSAQTELAQSKLQGSYHSISIDDR
jgi:uncharacterized protein (DUF362 family)